jgi:hypothetical protein
MLVFVPCQLISGHTPRCRLTFWKAKLPYVRHGPSARQSATPALSGSEMSDPIGAEPDSDARPWAAAQNGRQPGRTETA